MGRAFRLHFNARVIDASSFSPRASASGLMRALSLDFLCCVISSPLRSYYCTCAKRFHRSTIQLYQLPQLHLKLPESCFATWMGVSVIRYPPSGAATRSPVGVGGSRLPSAPPSPERRLVPVVQISCELPDLGVERHRSVMRSGEVGLPIRRRPSRTAWLRLNLPNLHRPFAEGAIRHTANPKPRAAL